MQILGEKVRLNQRHSFQVLRIGTAFMMVILLAYAIMSEPANIDAQTNPVLDTEIDVENYRMKEYGYQNARHRSFGSIDDNTFEYGGSTFTIVYIKWESEDSAVELGFRGCLNESDFTSLTIDDTTYTSIAKVGIKESICNAQPHRFQEFEFRPVSNPFAGEDSVDVELVLGSGSVATPTQTTTPATASLSPDPSDEERVTFYANGYDWKEFTVSSTERIYVVANPGSATQRVSITVGNPQINYCGVMKNDDKRVRSNGEEISLAGCVPGTGKVELRRASNGQVLETYQFTIKPSPTNPTPDSCGIESLNLTSGSTTVNGELTDECPGVNRQNRENISAYGEFYSFSLDRWSNVTIEMTAEYPPVDSYIYLLRGHDKNGDYITYNDDFELPSSRNSRIVKDLGPGNYTIEATSYHASSEGNFSLSVQSQAIAPPAPSLRVLPGVKTILVKSLSDQALDVTVRLSGCTSCSPAKHRLTPGTSHEFTDLSTSRNYEVSTLVDGSAERHTVQTNSVPKLMAIKDNFYSRNLKVINPPVSFIDGNDSTHNRILSYTNFRLENHDSDYEYALDVALGTGFQTGSSSSQRCVWQNAQSLQTTNWKNADPSPTFSLMRCLIGDRSTGLKLKAKAATGEEWTYYTFPSMQSWHRKNAKVSYTVPAADANDEMVTLLRSAVTEAVDAWNDSTAGVNFCESTSCGTNYDATINGSVKISIANCSDGIACVVYKGSTYPHITKTSLVVEKQPTTISGARVHWTNDLDDIALGPGYYYLPGVMMHEFGHTTGIGHNSNLQVNGVMVHVPRDQDELADYDIKAMRASLGGIELHN